MKNLKSLQTAGIFNSRISRYTSLSTAESALPRQTKLSTVILGDDNKYWVVVWGDAQRLIKKGYSLAL
mgnify:CR=1 FL=1